MAVDRSNYPSGFKSGVVIGEVPVAPVHRKVYYVGNNPTLVKGEITASNANDGSFYKPWSTIDQAFTTGKKGDVVYVRPGHTETIADATSLVPDVAGVSVIGMGTGESRPTITFATATTANIPISGADIRFSNMIFKCNIASQVAMITTTADGIVIDNCSFREGTATGLNFITVGAADGDSDRLVVRNCDFYMPTAGNGDHAIEFLFDMTGVVIEDCDIDGDFDEGSIAIPAGGNAQVNLQIRRCNIKNRLTNVAAISINGTDSSGIIQDCLLRTDTLATSLDSGSLVVDNVRWADETDQVTSTPVLPAVDSANNFIGVDDADNLAATTNVVANRDGSVLERLEAIYAAQVDDVATNFIGVDDADNVAATTNVVSNADGSILERLEFVQQSVGAGTNSYTQNSLLGKQVTRTTADVITGAAVPIFTVSGGRVLVTMLQGKVTTVIGAGATNAKFQFNPTTGTTNDICANLDIDADEAGALYSISGTAGDAMLRSESGAIRNMTANGLILDVGDIEFITAADRTGSISFMLYYIPLESGATIAAA